MASYNSGQISVQEESESYLGEEDLKDVLQILYDLASNWKIIGINLGIPIGKLEAIGKSESDAEHRLLELIKAWLQGNYDETRHGKPTWAKLAKAVEPVNKSVGRRIQTNAGLETSTGSTKESWHPSIGSSNSPPPLKPNNLTESIIGKQNESSLTFDNGEDMTSSRWWCCISRTKNSKKKNKSKSVVPDQENEDDKKSTLVTRATNPNSSVVLHASYCGSITGIEAEECLHKQLGNCYLTRFSEGQNCYVLSAQFVSKKGRMVHHFKIVENTRTMWLEFDERKKEFESFEMLLAYYKQNPLTYDSNTILGEVCMNKND